VERKNARVWFLAGYITLLCLLLCRISAEGVDIVLDCLCGDNTGKGLSLLKPLGTYILYGECVHHRARPTRAESTSTVLTTLCRMKDINILGTTQANKGLFTLFLVHLLC
jgi:hypothetical protein